MKTSFLQMSTIRIGQRRQPTSPKAAAEASAGLQTAAGRQSRTGGFAPMSAFSVLTSLFSARVLLALLLMHGSGLALRGQVSSTEWVAPPDQKLTACSPSATITISNSLSGDFYPG